MIDGHEECRGNVDRLRRELAGTTLELEKAQQWVGKHQLCIEEIDSDNGKTLQESLDERDALQKENQRLTAALVYIASWCGAPGTKNCSEVAQDAILGKTLTADESRKTLPDS